MRKRAPIVLFAAIASGVAMVAFSGWRSGPERLGAAASLEGLRLENLAGGEWSLEQERGKVVLVNFWATWCPPCRRETPDLVELHERYRERGFTVVGVSVDDDARTVVPPFAERYRVPYPMLVGGDSAFAARVSGLPTTVLVARDGRAVETYLGAISERRLRADIERLLAEKGAF